MVLNLRKERVKKIALAYLAIILVPLNIDADIIFFKDGMKTVCEDRAWEEGTEVKCEYQGLVLTYQKNDVLRIEKIETEKSSPKNQASSKTASGFAKQPPGITQPSSLKKAVPKKKLKSLANNAGSFKTMGLEFYNPRRPHKYWTAKNAKHNTFKAAVAALAVQYDRSPEWIQHHMGTTNDLDEIHRNLTNRKQNTAVKIQADDNETAPEILFYDPRRPHKYWTSTTAKHNTFQEALAVLAEKYGRSTDWVQQHIGNTNNLNEIHQNLANSSY
jgi:ribonuclease HI